MLKRIIVTLVFIILLAGIVYCASPAITHYGSQIFSDGLIVKDPNTASIDPNGGARVKYLGVNTAYDPNYQIKGSNIFLRPNGHLTLNSTETGNVSYGNSIECDSAFVGYVLCGNYGGNPNFQGSVLISGNLTMAAGKTIVIDGLTIQAKSGTVEDDGTITLPTGVVGILKVWSESEHGEFFVKADGTIEYINMTANVDDTATDGYLCVKDGGIGAVIENKLGSSKKIRYIFEYSVE